MSYRHCPLRRFARLIRNSRRERCSYRPRHRRAGVSGYAGLIKPGGGWQCNSFSLEHQRQCEPWIFGYQKEVFRGDIKQNPQWASQVDPEEGRALHEFEDVVQGPRGEVKKRKQGAEAQATRADQQLNRPVPDSDDKDWQGAEFGRFWGEVQGVRLHPQQPEAP